MRIRDALWAFAVLAACASPPASSPSTVSSPVTVGSVAPAPHPRPVRARVAASLLSPEGSQLGVGVRLEPEPEELVRPCYQTALGLDPKLAGWVFLGLEQTDGPRQVRVLRGSPLPEAFRACLVDRLRNAKIRYRFDPSSAPLVLYSSFEPEPAAADAGA